MLEQVTISYFKKKKFLLAEMIREFYEVRDITMALKDAYVKQSKCPLVHETGKETVAYRYKGISFSLYKKETPFVTWMDLEDNKLTGKPVTARQILCYLTYI